MGLLDHVVAVVLLLGESPHRFLYWLYLIAFRETFTRVPLRWVPLNGFYQPFLLFGNSYFNWVGRRVAVV